MILELSEKIPTDCDLSVRKSEEKIKLPAKNIIVLDTCVVLPSVLPPELRKPNVIIEYIGKICPEEKNRPQLRAERLRGEERRINVVNAIERGQFQKRGLVPGITNSVYGDLKFFEKQFETKNIDGFWGKASGDKHYAIFLPVEELRGCYKSFSGTFEENSDFSVATASYLLGSDFASDDYRSFNQASMNIFKNAYFERWGSRKRFLRHDSDSLLMLLR